MIADDTHKKLVGTPTKTGTISIEGMVRKAEKLKIGLRYVRSSGSKIPRHHHLIVPEENKRYRRYLTVRHPLDRLLSLYTYLRKQPYQWKSQADNFTNMTFPQFAQWIANLREELGFADELIDDLGANEFKWWRSPNIWLVSLSECAGFFNPHELIHLENLEKELAKVRPLAEWGSPLPHYNSSRGDSSSWQKHYPASTIRLVMGAWAEEDCYLGSYTV